MSKNNIINGSRSVSSTSCNSVLSDYELFDQNGGLQAQDSEKIKSRPSSTSKSANKAKRIRFFHNGNKFFNGVVIPVAPERYRSFDSLTEELTNLLTKSVTLPSGVRSIYSMDGKKVSNLDDLEDGKEYVCGGKGELFKKIEYTKIDSNLRLMKKLNSSRSSPQQNTSLTLPKTQSPDCVRPRIVILIRNGIKPRKVIRLLLNKRNGSSLEQILSALTEAAQLDSGAVRKVFTLGGQLVSQLSQFYSYEDVFFVYGNERCLDDDFELDFEESKAIQMYKKPPGVKNGTGTGPKPKMPEKKNKIFKSDDSLLKKLNEDSMINLPANLKQKYTIGRVIGDGNFAVVRLCKSTTSDEEFALKIIDKSKCKGKNDMIENEVKILRRIDHPYIMSLIDEHDTKTMLYLVCEFMEGGDLFDAITVAQKFSEEQSALMLSHLVSALAYLHNLNIVHRDVKPENLLVRFDGEKVKMLKLGDFGLACEVKKPLYTVCGTPTYVAPEILAESGYGLKIDVWAAGVILYILLGGYPPFVSQDNDQEKLFDCILSGQYDFPLEYWKDISGLAKELIQNMLQLQPELRLSAEDVLDHPWLNNATTTTPPNNNILQ